MQDQIETIGMLIIKGIVLPLIGLALTWASAHLPAWIASKVKNQRAAGVLDRLGTLAFTVVAEVEQTVISGLKGRATLADLMGARDQAIATLKSHLGDTGLKEIQTVLGLNDANAVDKLIISFIEAAVHTLEKPMVAGTLVEAIVPAPVGSVTTTVESKGPGDDRTTVTTVEPTTPAVPSGGQKGIATLGLMVLLAGLAGFGTLAGCGAAQDCKKPENMNSKTCTALSSIIDCTKGELPAVVTQFGPVVSQMIDEATGADGSVDWMHIEKMLGSLGAAYGTCVLGNIIENYMASPPKLSPGEVKPSIPALRDGLNHARTSLWKLDPSVKIHTSKGDL